jgi:magnesium chelatase family protein
VEPGITSAEQRIAHRKGRRGMTDEATLAEAAAARARPRPADELEGTSQRLLTAAIRQLQLSTEQVARVLAVAQSIAQLADVPSIGAAHLAEALQYRPRIAELPDLMEPKNRHNLSEEE